MTGLTFDRHCSEIVAQTDQLRALLPGADMTARVPACPGWNAGQLLRHLGSSQRWAESVVDARAQEPVPDEWINEVGRYTDEDAAVLNGWLAEGAARLAASLRAAGPGVTLWTPSPHMTSSRFWARREAYETLVHRADAAQALGAAFEADADVVRDAVEEWLEYAALPPAYEEPGLLGPGRTIALRAEGGTWWVDLTGSAPRWDRTADGTAAVELRGSPTDLLLWVYGRPAPGVTIAGDAGLLELWRTRCSFWLT